MITSQHESKSKSILNHSFVRSSFIGSRPEVNRLVTSRKRNKKDTMKHKYSTKRMYKSKQENLLRDKQENSRDDKQWYRTPRNSRNNRIVYQYPKLNDDKKYRPVKNNKIMRNSDLQHSSSRTKSYQLKNIEFKTSKAVNDGNSNACIESCSNNLADTRKSSNKTFSNDEEIKGSSYMMVNLMSSNNPTIILDELQKIDKHLSTLSINSVVTLSESGPVKAVEKSSGSEDRGDVRHIRNIRDNSDSKRSSDKTIKEFQDEIGFIDKIEELQYHDDDRIYNKAVEIILKHIGVDRKYTYVQGRQVDLAIN